MAGNTLGELNILLRAELAQLKADLGKANQEVQRSSKEFSRAMREQSARAKDSIDVLGDAIGVRMPRELKKVLAETQGVGRVMASAFAPIAALGFAGVLVQQVIPAVQALISWMSDEKLKAAHAAEVKIREEYALTLDRIESNARREIELIGLTGQAKIEAQKKFTQIDLDIARKAYDDKLVLFNEYNRVVNQNNAGSPFALGEQKKRMRGLELLGVPADAAERAKILRELAQPVVDLQAKLRILDKTSAFEGMKEGKKKAEELAKALKIANVELANSVQQWQMQAADTATKVVLQYEADLAKIDALEAKTLRTHEQTLIARLSAWQKYIADLDRSIEEAKKKADEALADSAKSRLGQHNLGLDLGYRQPVLPDFTGFTPHISSLQRITSELFNMKSMTDMLSQSFENWALDMTLNSRSVADSFGSMAKSIISSISAMIAKMLALWAVQQLVGLLMPTLGTKQIASLPLNAAPSIFTPSVAPLHDYPGYALPGRPYSVGVPEVMFPTGGMAIPLSQLKGGGGGTNVYIDARGSSDPAATESAVMRAMRRYYPASVQGSFVAQREYAARH